MRSSLPELFKKDQYHLFRPQKQGGMFSLYLRTNNFNQGSNSHNKTARYTNSLDNQANRPNKSLNVISNSLNKIISNNTIYNSNGDKQYKNLLNHRKRQAQSKSVFLQEKPSLNQEQQANSFKFVRKYVLNELVIIDKSIQIIGKQQQMIKKQIKTFSQESMEKLDKFEEKMLKQIAILHRNFRQARKDIIMQMKVNKEQISYLKDEINDFKQIYLAFEQKQQKFRCQLTDSKPNVEIDKV